MAGRARRRRSSARRENAAGGGADARLLDRQAPFKTIRNPFPPLNPLSEEQLAKVHDMAMRIAEEQGLKILADDARATLEAAGADVDHASEMVRMDRDLLMGLVSKAPSSFTLTPRNRNHAIEIGGNVLNFGMVSGPPNAHDTVRGRRQGSFADYCELLKLAQCFNVLSFYGNQTLAPIDLAVNTRHLDTTLACIKYTDKIFSSMSIGAGRVTDSARMWAIARGISLEEMKASPSAITNINVNSPRLLDREMSSGAMALAALGQAVIVTPFTLMGAMTPVTIPAALAQAAAEALITIALIQSASPGSPVIMGSFTSNVDMRSGAPAFGTPENAWANLAGGQIARHYKLPHRTSACNASNTVDAQAAYETQMALWSACLTHGNLIYHAAGWLEGGLVASYEKFILDIEVLQMMAKFMEPVSFKDEEFGLDAMEEVGPGGHFFGAAHTMERYKTAFHEPIISDWQNNENWVLAGARTATDRAADLWQQALKEYEQPVLPEDRLEELEAYVAKRKEEIGDGEP